MMISFYVAPYAVDFLRIPYARFRYADIWLWGLLLFGLLSYIIGSTIISRKVLVRISKNRDRLHAVALCLILLLSWLYLNLLGLPYILSTAGSLLYVAFWIALFKRRFNAKLSTLLISGSLAAMVLTFIFMGNVPLLDPDILKVAKLSPARELFLPVFMLGAVSFFLNKTGQRAMSYWLRLAVFVTGAILFALNGDMHDPLAIGLGCLLSVLYRCLKRDRMLIIGSLALTGLLIPYLVPSLLGFFRQSFNLQVLRHILLFVEDPILGSTKGAVSLGLRRDFLGANMIYGEGEDWTLTSTWLGPAYLDLGLLGVFLTMFALGAALELMFQFLKASTDDLNPATIYITTLSMILSLFEDGASLPMVIFIILMVYATLSHPPNSKLPQSGCGVRLLGISPLIPILAISLILIGLGLSAYAYCSEFGSLKTLTSIQAITQQRTQVTLALEQNRFYHAKLVGLGTVCMEGNMTVFSEADGMQENLKQVSFSGCLWVARRDQIDLGWFSAIERESRCAFLLELAEPPEGMSELYLRIETPSLSPWVSNETLIQIAACINALTIVLLAIGDKCN